MDKQRFERAAEQFKRGVANADWLFNKEDVPLIIEDMRETFDGRWDKVLVRVTGMDIVPEHHRGLTELIARDWLMYLTSIYNYQLTIKQN